MAKLGLDIGSNSVGSCWINDDGAITAGTSIFPAGVEESDDKRGDPKNAKRRMTRRARITLRRRAERKRRLRRRLIDAGLLPATAEEFQCLLDSTDPWELRQRGLDEALDPYAFGRVLLHLAQRRGALGLNLPDPDDPDASLDDEDGKVKAAIGEVRAEMLERKARTFGEFMAILRAERITPITSKDRRPDDRRQGLRAYREPIRNKAGSYERCADRAMIRDEFTMLWDAQKRLGGATAELLTDELSVALDNPTGDADWRHKGDLFGQRMTKWDLGTLGRCVLEPTERCVPHADRYASCYRVVETLNNLKVIERGKHARALTPEEREDLRTYLSGPLGTITSKKKGSRPKRTVTVTDLRKRMGWKGPSKNSPFRFNIEADADNNINTDWFSREIIHGAITPEAWDAMDEKLREGINRAVVKFDPSFEEQVDRFRAGLLDWAGLDEARADALIEAWKLRPKPDSKRLNMSRRAVRNLLTVMDRAEPWDDPESPTGYRWLTQIEARKLIAEDAEFVDAVTGQALDEHTRRRYATGARGMNAEDRYYMSKHVLRGSNGEPIIWTNPITGDDEALAEPPPAPLISNPVVRKAIHEVRRHLVEYMIHFERKPDEVRVELVCEAKMGAKDADRLLFRNRLRARIRKEIIDRYELHHMTSAQQRVAVDRVVLAVQQNGVCPLCGNQLVQHKITPLAAAQGEGCELAHIIPRAAGGHNGYGNIVLSHKKCNRDMARRTPRQFWDTVFPGKFDEGFGYAENIYKDIQRIKPGQIKSATGEPLWACYFDYREDFHKLNQFKKDIKDVKEMTNRQDAATKYATKQVMAYLADALYDGKGLPERSSGDDRRRIFTSRGQWTARLRREWGLFFDPHDYKAKGLDDAEEHERKEKDRGDHRHHSIDAIITALCTAQVQNAWDAREKEAADAGVNTADENAMRIYRKQHPLPLPLGYTDRDAFRDAVRKAVYGDDPTDKPICHRPVKRKLIGALHEETLFGPVLDPTGQPTNNYTAKKSVLNLNPKHLRLPRPETENEAIDRLAARRMRQQNLDDKAARKWARARVKEKGFHPLIVDPPPGKSGIVRDIALRKRLRTCLEEAGIDPDKFTANQVKKLAEAGGFKQASGVPIKSMVLLRTMSDPVLIDRKQPVHGSDAMTTDPNPASKRAYVGGNNHHIEIRATTNKQGKEVWTGLIVSAYEAAQRKLAKYRAFREAGIPKPKAFAALPKKDQAKLRPRLREIEQTHTLVDRNDDATKGGRFVMSLCEGETLYMKHKETGELGYFVVAKLDKPNRTVLVPHWDARAAGERKDAEGNKVPHSKRDQFTVTPTDLITLAPPDHDHAVKVSVSPMGKVTVMEHD